MFSLLDLHRDLIVQGFFKSVPDARLAIELAIFYHDIVYEVGSAYNEVRSAGLLVDHVMPMTAAGQSFGVHTKTLWAVQAILCSRSHDHISDPNIQLFLDFDLWGFACEGEEYHKRQAAVEAEMLTKVSPEAYKAGRLGFLGMLLGRSRNTGIYGTRSLSYAWEYKAVSNITRDVDLLVCEV